MNDHAPLPSWRDTATTRAILEMLRFAGGDGKPALRLVVVHDDAEREVDDRGGAEKVLGAGFTEISIRDDWITVFAP
jgi:hypothetical protein